MAQTIRVLIADDHGVLRAGLYALLAGEPDLEVIAEADNGATAVRLATDLKPDIILMDVSMPDMTGIEATRLINRVLPATKVLILTVHEDNILVREAIEAGASGYILKRAVKSELIGAIQAVRRGDLYVHPSMTRSLLLHPEPQPEPAHRSGLLDDLTPREKEVLQLIAQGYTNTQISDKLAISVRTVEYHRGNVMSKLALESRVDLVRFAAEHGLLDFD